MNIDVDFGQMEDRLLGFRLALGSRKYVTNTEEKDHKQ